MHRYLKVAVTAVLAFALCGCPATKGPLRRYVVINNSTSAITDLTISVGGGVQTGADDFWEQTLPGQGWMYSTHHDAYLTLSWKDEAGDHKEIIRPTSNSVFNSKTDLYIELLDNGALTSRPIEPPPDNRTATLILVYLPYCLIVALFIGVPLGLAGIIAYVLFKFIRSALIAIALGLQGDRSVFQFSIREIALLTVAVAIACGWYIQMAMKH